MKKFAIHPGNSTIRYDVAMRYTDAVQLAKLYGLKKGEYIVWEKLVPVVHENIEGYVPESIVNEWEDYIHLFPRANGDYKETLRKIINRVKKESKISELQGKKDNKIAKKVKRIK